ncbi:efflux RND transporter periplasmic adaptor subunit [Marinobacter subterrani]|uniref:efflux RND transporter periplasmic adaptor subunit n=1 Tax=Marinobacter subterrani TaxID=1658765 RepID=UPI002356E866|nr:efflux RND transporter periplasmic adaptor subunit [Marinobacter subterrani]
MKGRALIPFVVAFIILAAMVGYLYLQWQGPLLPGYKITRQRLLQQVVASGTVSSQSLVEVGSEVTGVVKARHVREGDRVNPGDLLLELNDDVQLAQVREAEAALAELALSTRPQAEAALREAVNAHQLAVSELKRREALFTHGQIAAEQLEQARSAEVSARSVRDRLQSQLATLMPGGTQTQQLMQRLAVVKATLNKTRIVASVAGTVQSRNVEPGDLVQPGRTLLEIYSAMSREIVVPVDERSVGQLALGQPAQLVADAYPETILDAKVSFLDPAVDTSRGTLDVHLALDSDADFLRQGMTVSATITTATRANALVIGNDALRNIRADRAEVLLVRDNRVVKISVRLGLRGAFASEILEGLEGGDLVLSAGAEEGSRVRVDQRSLLSMEGG